VSRDEIRERAEYVLTDEFADMLVEAPEDAPRWCRYLAADVLALLDAPALSVPVEPEEDE
jgi:hypothetical protein